MFGLSVLEVSHVLGEECLHKIIAMAFANKFSRPGLKGDLSASGG